MKSGRFRDKNGVLYVFAFSVSIFFVFIIWGGKTYIPDNSILQATVFSFKKPLMKKYIAQVTLLETLNLSIKTLS